MPVSFCIVVLAFAAGFAWSVCAAENKDDTVTYGVADLSGVILSEPQRSKIMQILENYTKTPSQDITRLVFHDGASRGMATPLMTTADETVEQEVLHNQKQALNSGFRPSLPIIGSILYADPWMPMAGTLVHSQSMTKRRSSGKLCYINPIACFGRRQREAAK